MDKELIDVSSYIKTVNCVDLSTVLGKDGLNDKAFLEYLADDKAFLDYLANDNYDFLKNALTVATRDQLTDTLQSYASNFLKRKLWITPALARLRNLPGETFINLEA